MRHRVARRAAVAAAFALLAVAIGARIWMVNADALAFPVETYPMQQAVSLDGAFAEYSVENTKGYSLTVTSAQRMSVNEYLDLYGEDEEGAARYREGLGLTTDFDSKTLVVLEIQIQNDKGANDERGYLDSLGWALTSAEKPAIWPRVVSSLLDCTIPQAEGAWTFKLSIKPGTTYTLHVPFGYTTDREFPAANGSYYSPVMEPGEYSLILTKAPVRKIVKVDVD